MRKALHALRRILAPDAIPCDGQRVSIDPLRVGCDAVELRKALEAGRPAEALKLYRGDLLRGFHLAGVPSFQRWLDLERQRLRLLVRRLDERPEIPHARSHRCSAVPAHRGSRSRRSRLRWATVSRQECFHEKTHRIFVFRRSTESCRGKRLFSEPDRPSTW